ncbi:MAG: hypothetical protein Wins2KO_19140 [Winogradskyella sp.]
MKYILLLLTVFLTFNCVAQSKAEGCKTELIKEHITTEKLTSVCVFLKDKAITSYKVKVPGKRTLSFTGGLISKKAQLYISNAEIGDYITIFDIKTTQSEDLPSIVITLKE